MIILIINWRPAKKSRNRTFNKIRTLLCNKKHKMDQEISKE